MSLELELWAMNSARISALEAGGGGGGSASDLCIRVPKFDWSYVYDHPDEFIEVELEEYTFGWTADFTVPDDEKPHYAVIGSNVGFGVQASLIVMESCGGQLLSGDEVRLSELTHDEPGVVGYIPVYSNSLISSHQTLVYDPEREDMDVKTYSIAYDDDAYIRPKLLKNGVTYRILYDRGFVPVIDDPELESAFEEMRDFIASSTVLMVAPGTYEEIPVVVRNGGNT